MIVPSKSGVQSCSGRMEKGCSLRADYLKQYAQVTLCISKLAYLPDSVYDNVLVQSLIIILSSRQVRICFILFPSHAPSKEIDCENKEA